MSQEKYRDLTPPANYPQAKGYFWHIFQDEFSSELIKVQEEIRNKSIAAPYANKAKRQILLREIFNLSQNYIKFCMPLYAKYLNGIMGFYIKDHLAAAQIPEEQFKLAAQIEVAASRKKYADNIQKARRKVLHGSKRSR